VKLTLGSAPDSWGVWFSSDERQTPWHRFLDEVAEAGYRWIELGPYGYLPTDLDRLRIELERRELGVTGTFVMFHFEDPKAWEERRSEVRRTCETLKALGAQYLILIDDVYTNLFTGQPLVPAALDDAAWGTLIDTSNRIGEVAVEHGLRPVLHPHAETHVEYEDQIERFLADADSALGLCLDVGHHAYRGGDPVAFFRRYHDRIPYLHLKSVDPELQRRVEAEGIPFATAVAMDMFVEPSKGAVPLEKPLPIAKRTYEYLRGLGLG
jgi:inosose dehydratase